MTDEGYFGFLYCIRNTWWEKARLYLTRTVGVGDLRLRSLCYRIGRVRILSVKSLAV